MARPALEEEILAHLVEKGVNQTPKIEGLGPPAEWHEFLQAIRPADVAHQRHQLQQWWSYPGAWQRRLAISGDRPLPGWPGYEEPDGEGVRRVIAESFAEAELYWVSPEMTDVIVSLAPTIPDCTPQPPVECAFVVFARSIPGTDAETGTPIYTSAFLWHQVEMWRIGESLAIETYAWRDLVALYRSMPEKLQERYREVLPTRMHPTGRSDWPLGTMISDFSMLGDDESDTMKASMVEDRKLLATFWALCSQRIVIETRERPYTRQQVRQAERQGRRLEDIRVIRLREPTRKTTEGSRDVEWSHRWIVGRHWRNQWYPSSDEHRPKLIEAYQKGPADKPLKVRETVRALVR